MRNNVTLSRNNKIVLKLLLFKINLKCSSQIVILIRFFVVLKSFEFELSLSTFFTNFSEVVVDEEFVQPRVKLFVVEKQSILIRSDQCVVCRKHLTVKLEIIFLRCFLDESL